jgi:hypothetical protein
MNVAAQPPEVTDVIILIDATGSMVGRGDSIGNIWSEVLGYVLSLVDALPQGTRIAIVPFDSGPRRDLTYPASPPGSLEVQPVVLDGNTRQTTKAHIRALPVEGQNTWIYESLGASLEQMKRWQESDPTRTHRQCLFLYTDGQDNGPHSHLGIDGIVELFKAVETDMPFLYAVYGDIGFHLSPDEKTELEKQGIVVTTGIPERRVVVETPELDFGDLSVNEEGVSRDILFSSDAPTVWGTSVEIEVEGPAILSVSPQNISLQERVPIQLRSAAGGLNPGVYRARLLLRSQEPDVVIQPPAIIILFSWPEPPPTQTPTSEPTATPTPTPKPTATPTPTPTVTPRPSPTPTPPPPPTLELGLPGGTINLAKFDDPENGRSTQFSVTSTSSLTEPLRVAHVDCPSLEHIGVEVDPEMIPPNSTTLVTLTVSAQSQLDEGTYRGNLTFASRDGVSIKPEREVPLELRVRSAFQKHRRSILLIGGGSAGLLSAALTALAVHWSRLPFPRGLLRTVDGPAGIGRRVYNLGGYRKLLGRREVTIGRGRNCDIRLDGGAVQPMHARIVASMREHRVRRNGRVRSVKRLRYFLENLGTGKCKVNGCPVEKGHRMRLFNDARIRIGEYGFYYNNPGAGREGG